MVDLAAYRIVQEALANVTRHARPARAVVTVGYREDGVHLRVDDEGASTATSGAPAGHGIIGMRERAALCGGWAGARVRADGGWTVEAVPPLRESAPHPKKPSPLV
ncbi:sensor histidine kinase [Streptomyces niveiscabiei]|uniref:sensor histidine kinase n=1 Tax=Streptomyces niveiscabiei TaxID=164115 RepID=UPI0029CA408D|nr:hypothetical protein [Streptomyces niveiscabiei]